MKFFLAEQHDASRREILRRYLNKDWQLVMTDDAVGSAAYNALMADADAVLSMRWNSDSPPAPKLKLIQLPGAGLDAIDWQTVPAGCAVCNVYEHEIGISEFVVLALLEWEICLRRADAALRRGVWINTWAVNDDVHGELFGKTVGFIGYGRIARETARRLRPFGVRLIACTRSPSRADEDIGKTVDRVGAMDTLDAMLGEVDYLVISCPLTDATRGLIDERALARLRDTAVIVNVGRGAIVDEHALYKACQSRAIGGAVIDTWYQYPSNSTEPQLPSRYPFHELDNVILSPHGSGWSGGLFERRFRLIADNLNRLANNEPLLNLASPDVG